MKILKKVVAVIIIAIAAVCIFGGFTVPDDEESGLITIYSNDGRILKLRENDAEVYLNDGWTEDFSDVITMVWKSDGSSKIILKGQIPAYVKEGWTVNKSDVTVLMVDEKGNEKEVFKDNIEKNKENGWRLKEIKEEKNESKANIKAVALTFDDGPNNSTTSRLLDILENNNAKSTFFILGSRAANGADCIKRMYESGMEIGSHTFDHTELTKLGDAEIKAQIDKTNDSIRNITGENPTLLRPPYGSYNSSVKEAAGVPIILWSVDTLDWKSRNADSIYQTVMSTVKDGSILLFHDIYETTVDSIEQIIPALKEQGYELLTVSELAEAKKKTMKNGEVYTDF